MEFMLLLDIADKLKSASPYLPDLANTLALFATVLFGYYASKNSKK